MTVIKIREVMYFIDRFTAETNHGRYTWTQQNVWSLIQLFPFDQIPKMKICHMVVSEHPENIEGRRTMIATDVFESDYSAEDGSIDNDGAALDEEDESGLGEAVVRTGVNQSVTEELEEVQ